MDIVLFLVVVLDDLSQEDIELVKCPHCSDEDFIHTDDETIKEMREEDGKDSCPIYNGTKFGLERPTY